MEVLLSLLTISGETPSSSFGSQLLMGGIGRPGREWVEGRDTQGL